MGERKGEKLEENMFQSDGRCYTQGLGLRRNASQKRRWPHEESVEKETGKVLEQEGKKGFIDGRAFSS